MVKIKGPIGNTGIKKSSPIWHDLYKSILCNEPFQYHILDKLKENRIIDENLVLKYARPEISLGGGLIDGELKAPIHADCFWRLEDGNKPFTLIYHEIKTGKFDLQKMMDKYEDHLYKARLFIHDEDEFINMDKGVIQNIFIWYRDPYNKNQREDINSKIPFITINLELIDPILDEALLSIGLFRRQES